MRTPAAAGSRYSLGVRKQSRPLPPRVEGFERKHAGQPRDGHGDGGAGGVVGGDGASGSAAAAGGDQGEDGAAGRAVRGGQPQPQG